MDLAPIHWLTRDEPNRRLICQICTEWTSYDDLYVDSNGDKWDICKPCGEQEDTGWGA